MKKGEICIKKPLQGFLCLTSVWGQKIDPMKQNIDLERITNLFMAPAKAALQGCSHKRACPELDDWQWVRMGVERALNQQRTGRGFLQDWAMADQGSAVRVSHFFETLKSKRRLKLIEELNTKLARQMPAHPRSKLADLDDLDKVDVYAGDGHYHKASCHDAPIEGKRRAVGHFYTLNLRSHALTHLAAADLQGGRKKTEHDMSALKRTSLAQLRQGAAKGRQVLYVWDCAGINLEQWHNWKQAGGVYFLSRLKEKMQARCYGDVGYDRSDPVNAGVLSDQFAGTASGGVMIRYIRYRCPHTGKEYEFITNHMKIRPGVLAWLYMRRWDIEKTYDTFKNKLCEQKAWASSLTAKSMQAQFLCLLHNLTTLFECHISDELGIDNDKEIRRCQKRIEAARIQCAAKGLARSPLYENPLKRSQLTLKFIRWLRHHLHLNSLMSVATNSLRQVYAVF